MPFSQKAIHQIAHLARLGLENTSEDHPIQEDLARIVAMVDQIQAVDVTGIEPMSHPLEKTTQRVRLDLVTELNQRDALLTLAPLADTGLYLVPQVIE